VDAPPHSNLGAGTHVTLIREGDSYSKVRTADGTEAFVRTSLLKQRSQADGVVGDYTHTLSARALAYDRGPPAQPPDLDAPRPQQQILQEHLQLNGVFLTEKTQREVIAPMASQPTFQGEKCWPAYTCTNPRCPGRGRGGRPYLFINPRPGTETLCPACLARRDLHAETDEDRMRYRGYVQPYLPPTTVRRLRELDAERMRAIR
jgi:hypothetical protein